MAQNFYMPITPSC